MIRALTLWRPWASAVVQAGKDVENRTWKPPDSVIGTRIALHAGKRLDPHAMEVIRRVCGHDRVTAAEPGVIVCTVLVTGWTLAAASLWHAPGRYGWCIRDPIAPEPTVPDPPRIRGRQGLWTMDEGDARAWGLL